MLGYYKYSRENIAKIIRNSPKTKDGYYFVRKFPELNNEQGKLDGEKDSKYYYPRNIFTNKFVFNNYEIDSYLSKTENDLDFKKMQNIDDKIYETISDFVDYGLNEKIPNYEFNLNELIDTSIYFYNIKFA